MSAGLGILIGFSLIVFVFILAPYNYMDELRLISKELGRISSSLERMERKAEKEKKECKCLPSTK